MNHWLMKSEPDVFSWDDLVRKGKAEWDGVRNHLAQSHMKAMRKGDRALFYHSNIGLEVVGVMEIVEEAAPDSTDETGRWIAVHVAPVEALAIGLADDPLRLALQGGLRITAGSGIGGVATSGRHGRSFSLGIADAVTVLARDAATADAAATLIANAVDCDSPAVRRAPAVPAGWTGC